jgi:hypothetical protein
VDNTSKPNIPPTPQPKALPRLAHSMAYSMPAEKGVYNTPTTYRLSRGFPLLRRGVAVSAVPKFKALTLYSHTANTPTPFQTAQVGKNIAWPVGPK